MFVGGVTGAGGVVAVAVVVVGGGSLWETAVLTERDLIAGSVAGQTCLPVCVLVGESGSVYVWVSEKGQIRAVKSRERKGWVVAAKESLAQK